MLLEKAYNMLVNDTVSKVKYGGNNCAHQVQTTLDSLGFSYIWNNQDTDDEVHYL